MKKFIFTLFCVFSSSYLIGQEYYFYATAESEDEVALIKFNGKKSKVVKTIPVGVWPAEIEGPHGITVSPDGKHWYLTMAHGNPYGTLYKFSTETNKVVGQTTLGLFPATMQISKATGLLYCVNFNLHGDMVPSSVSVVDPVTMTEIKKITTGAMPHGSRISPDGLKHYSVAMMSGELFEIDAISLQVSRKLNLDNPDGESQHKMSGESATMDHSRKDDSEMDHSNMDKSKTDHSKMDHSMMDHSKMKHSAVKPTWVIPHPTAKKVYVAGNGSNEILEVDLTTWSITHKFPGDKGPYNVEISPDGNKMVVTYKTAGKTGIWDLNTKKELARIKNNRRVSHGVAISPDSRYAFISVEGVGGEPGSVDILDLDNQKLVTTTEIGKQAGGIYFWKMTDSN